MNGFLAHLRISLRLYARNKMALFYSYLFPVIFLAAFAVLYRSDVRPLAGHMGELLTVAALGGACFGLPTGMVSERERGVWRRYRLAPIPTRSLIASTAVARYFSLLTAGLLQVGLAIATAALIVSQREDLPRAFAYYLPIPNHPFQLLVAFTFVTFAFVGLGLVIAMLADNVPAVQALGQCIFLPMLIIGGVAVKLSVLPEPVQHLSAFFPGRYAVEAINACVIGNGLGGPAAFNIFALFLIGCSGCIAGTKMFRWDAQQRFVERGGKGWIAAAVAAWVIVGILAEQQNRIKPLLFGTEPDQKASAEPTPPRPRKGTNLSPDFDAPAPAPVPTAPGAAAPAAAGSTATAAVPAGAPARKGPATWRDVGEADIDGLAWDAPADSGIVAPMAKITDDPGAALVDQLRDIRAWLPDWAPAAEKDPVQHVRNLLYVAAAPDVMQYEIEPYLPHIVLGYLREKYPDPELSKLLCWIALHPLDGDIAAAGQLEPLGIEFKLTQPMEVRRRAYYYAQKFLARTADKIPEE